MQEANRYRNLLDRIGKSLTTDLDEELIPPAWGVSENMKQLLDKKKDQL